MMMFEIKALSLSCGKETSLALINSFFIQFTLFVERNDSISFSQSGLWACFPYFAILVMGSLSSLSSLSFLNFDNNCGLKQHVVDINLDFSSLMS